MTDRKLYRLRVQTFSGAYEGTFFSLSPEKRLSDTLAKLEGYLNLKDVVVADSGERYPFVMISTTSIETIILLQEYAEEAVPGE